MLSQETVDLFDTINFAALRHRHQRRKGDDSSYIIHPLGVAKILHSEGGVNDLKVLQAAVLHDTVEDTNTTLEELKQTFGEEVARIVSEVTDNKSLSADARKRHQVEHAKDISHEGKLVKLADKIYNLRDLLQVPPKGWDSKRIQGYFVWAKAVISQLKGTNEALEKIANGLWETTFTFEGEKYPTIPRDVNLDQFLEDYYTLMSKK
ncbi:guanosine-3',5'-bis 3'-diphosphatase [Planoprotostelium fungivorum]|uniref:Guanosine-3',5'-bis(diphosphate) 3'-pyrophosphohydrolase MESH1 n=1 Tax=Planoprotostelium fungivorum TaxID=1890364 RepID=A0A2P6NH98_9EUKA|nr:guanosine-3',5'-bis 3'-diphosphatase [Planoprotostelium fungivorum]